MRSLRLTRTQSFACFDSDGSLKIENFCGVSRSCGGWRECKPSEPSETERNRVKPEMDVFGVFLVFVVVGLVIISCNSAW